MKNLKDYFVEVRKRPGMYLGDNTISKLYDHLQGYKITFWFNEVDNPFDRHFFNNFNDFVYRYYGVTTNDNWKGVILEQCFGNEQAALDIFFELFDLFIGNAKTLDTRKVVLDLLDKLIFQDGELKRKLGDRYSVVLAYTFGLLKEHALSKLKQDYDWIYQELREECDEFPALESVLTELEKKHTA